MAPKAMERANWIGAPAFFNLNHAVVTVNQALDFNDHVCCCYLVGSSLQRRDFRDVDVRAIIDDADFDRLFPGCGTRPDLNAMWSLMCVSISEWLQSRTGLLIDFQIKRRTEANAEFKTKDGHPRCALGIFLVPSAKDTK